MQIHIVTLNVEGDQVGAWATVHADKADALAAKLEARATATRTTTSSVSMSRRSRWKRTSTMAP